MEPIEAYDLIRVAISDLNGPNTEDVRISRVSGKGTLSLPYEAPLKVGGMTESQIETLIQKRYRDDNIIARAAVSVLKLESAPENAAHLALTDTPIHPVPEALKPLYFHWPQPGMGGMGQKH